MVFPGAVPYDPASGFPPWTALGTRERRIELGPTFRIDSPHDGWKIGENRWTRTRTLQTNLGPAFGPARGPVFQCRCRPRRGENPVHNARRRLRRFGGVRPLSPERTRQL